MYTHNGSEYRTRPSPSLLLYTQINITEINHFIFNIRYMVKGKINDISGSFSTDVLINRQLYNSEVEYW